MPPRRLYKHDRMILCQKYYSTDRARTGKGFSTSWGHVRFPTMTDKLTASSMGCRVSGVRYPSGFSGAGKAVETRTWKQHLPLVTSPTPRVIFEPFQVV